MKKTQKVETIKINQPKNIGITNNCKHQSHKHHTKSSLLLSRLEIYENHLDSYLILSHLNNKCTSSEDPIEYLAISIFLFSFSQNIR